MARGLSFTEALRTIHTAFGSRKGLLNMEENAQKRQAKRYRQQEWHYIHSFTGGTRWFVSVGFFFGLFALNNWFGQYETLKSAFAVTQLFVVTSVFVHLITILITAFQHRREIGSIQATGSPTLISLYLLTALLLLLNHYLSTPAQPILPPVFTCLLTTVIETGCLVYLSASLLLIRQVLRDGKNREKLKMAQPTRPAAGSSPSTAGQ